MKPQIELFVELDNNRYVHSDKTSSDLVCAVKQQQRQVPNWKTTIVLDFLNPHVKKLVYSHFDYTNLLYVTDCDNDISEQIDLHGVDNIIQGCWHTGINYHQRFLRRWGNHYYVICTNAEMYRRLYPHCSRIHILKTDCADSKQDRIHGQLRVNEIPLKLSTLKSLASGSTHLVSMITKSKNKHAAI